MTGPNFAEVIARDMGLLPEATRKAIRPRLLEAGEVVATEARGLASWSSRIPGTIRVTVSFRLMREEVTVRAGNAGTPHARLFEDIKGKGKFRHPVFADSARLTRRQWALVDQVSRPFLFPAAQAKAEQATTALQAALDEAASSIGFGGS